MKITKTRLRQIIREEVSRWDILRENNSNKPIALPDGTWKLPGSPGTWKPWDPGKKIPMYGSWDWEFNMDKLDIMRVFHDLAPVGSKGIAHDDLIKILEKIFKNTGQGWIEYKVQDLRDQGAIDDGYGGTWKPCPRKHGDCIETPLPAQWVMTAKGEKAYPRRGPFTYGWHRHWEQVSESDPK